LKVLLIYNPNAGHRIFPEYLDYLIGRFQKKGLQLVFHRMDRAYALDNVFAEVVSDKQSYQKIVASGGDGTINQVVNQMIKYDLDMPLGIFPMGTCNDYARQFCPAKSLEKQADIILQDKITYSDVGMVNQKCFINVASMGVIIDAGQKTDNNAKKILGPLAYYLRAVGEVANLEPIRVKISSEEMDFAGEVFFLLVLNGQSAGGFNKIGYMASVNDGLLDVLVLKKCLLVDLPTILFEIINGMHLQNKHILTFKTKHLQIQCEDNVVTDIDGERAGTPPLDISVIPNRLRILTPHQNEPKYAAKHGIAFPGEREIDLREIFKKYWIFPKGKE